MKSTFSVDNIRGIPLRYITAEVGDSNTDRRLLQGM